MKTEGGVSALVCLLVSSELHMSPEVRRMLFVSLSQGAIHHPISDASDRFQAESAGTEANSKILFGNITRTSRCLSFRHSLLTSEYLQHSAPEFRNSDWTDGFV